MTQDEKRIKIAEACGWSGIKLKQLFETEEDDRKLALVGIPLSDPLGEMRIPDYFNDLNAMRDVAMTLSGEELKTYRQTLGRICGNDIVAPIAAIDATAAQRAEAFGLTLNLWNS